MRGNRYVAPSAEGVQPILGTLRKQPPPPTRPVPNPYPVAYDTPIDREALTS